MKTFIVLLACIVVGCNTDVDNTPARPEHHIRVASDLSDRILITGQPENDLALIALTASYFRELVKSSLYIGSHDRLTIEVIPQSSDTERVSSQNELSIDMASIPMAQRHEELSTQLSRLMEVSEQLYAAAPKKESFSGADISAWFQRLYTPIQSSDGHQIRQDIILITDFYVIDEESMYRDETEGNYIPKEILQRWRNDPNANTDEFRLIPVRTDLSHVNILVIGLEPRSKAVTESAHLRAIWTRWLTDMKVGYFELHENTSDVNQMRDIIYSFLNRENQ